MVTPGSAPAQAVHQHRVAASATGGDEQVHAAAATSAARPSRAVSAVRVATQVGAARPASAAAAPRGTPAWKSSLPVVFGAGSA